MNDAMAIADWVGRSEVREDRIVASLSSAMTACLDRDDPPGEGDPLPPGWHWLYFWEVARQSRLGPDGHAARGEFLPPIALPRRMWGGNRLVFHGPICIGDLVRCVSTIESIDFKDARTGPIALVKVGHRYFVDDTLVLEEWHDIIYRGAHSSSAPSPRAVESPADVDWRREIVPDEVLLFRYSALTFNGHRIHYDARYVMETEGYPGLIVHGPLTATLLLDLFRHERPSVQPVRATIRAMRPLFVNNRLVLEGKVLGAKTHLWALDENGAVAMTVDIQTS